METSNQHNPSLFESSEELTKPEIMKEIDKSYYRNLERIVKQMLKPLKNLPFNLVIEAMCSKKVIPFDKDIKENKILLKNLIKAVNIASKEINLNGILRPRPNEVGNDIEPHLKNALKRVGFEAHSPKANSGKSKSTGYPDIEFKDAHGNTNYIECKTYNIENINTTQRSFYFSPSEDFKITKDAIHFIISFEIYDEGRVKSNNIYKTKSWKILDAFYLLCDVKYEFNSDNKRMYDKKLILAEGKG